ncbi:MAG: 30S ribosomal protein S16 [Chlamydiae bacterium]|nr:30S ribosomal protein S16 [Chlamydiota bacterium]
MALKIRLRQQGRKNNLVYRLVLTDSRSPRDGKYIENLGWYNPHEEESEKTLQVHGDRIAYWLGNGAELTEKAEKLVSRGAPDVYASYRQARQAAEAKARAKRQKRKKQGAVSAA